MEQILRILNFVLSNFGPLVVFYGVNHFYGLRTAIIFSVIFAVLETVYKLIKKEPFTGFFKFSVLVTLIFGGLDLLVQAPLFFQYEAATTNAITGVYFGMTIWATRPIIQEFVEKKTNKLMTDPNAILRCRILTVLWTAYFFVKAGAYTYLSSRYSIEEALIIRSTVGSVSFYGLLAFSILFAKPVLVFFQQKGLLPTYELGPKS